MKRPVRPPGGFVFESPGYTFSLQPVWPDGFIPQDWSPARDHSANSTKARNTALARGITGTLIGGLSDRSKYRTSDITKAMMRKSP